MRRLRRFAPQIQREAFRRGGPGGLFRRSLAWRTLARRTVGARGNCRVWNRLLIIADAAAEISANPCDEAYPRNGRIIGARSWQHIADLGNFTFRLLNRRVDFRAKRPAGGVLSGAHVGAKRFLEVGIASSNDRAVART